MEDLDRKVKEQLTPRLVEMFGNSLGATLEKQDEWFQSVLKPSKSGYSLLRTKINLEGKGAVRCWSKNKKTMEILVDWTLHQARPRLLIRNVWIMGKEAGITIDSTDVQLDHVEHICPF